MFPCSSTSCPRPFVGVRRNPTCIEGALNPTIRCYTIELYWNPHSSYLIPAGTHYILMTIQITVFALDVVPETVLPALLQNGFRVGDFRKAKQYLQKTYKLPQATPAHPPAEERPALGKRPLSKNPFEVPSRYKKKCGSPRPRDGSSDLRLLKLPRQCLSLNRYIPLLHYL
ncbi:hypothetical protein NPIL_173201 [Nephila pilipes]|uniref:Uncharacterized protein n=1 Tax=Nephila pilipes TaxID=299642 RepID=A0A8X6QNJ7_NEPPI|nr:hypothetical protein NPIL_173201 [Nephila pilipes]